MRLTMEQLKSVYFGALHFRETDDGYLQAFQYTDSQMDYFNNPSFSFWYDRCSATTAKTFEMTTTATRISFAYKFIWKGSEDTVEMYVNGLAT